jgi:decaprenylphospho-beta-D-ribofuranose 2-oxidase
MPGNSEPMSRRLLLYPRKQLDIRWRDLAAAGLRCFFSGSSAKSEAAIRRSFAPGEPLHVAFTVRSSFDLCLQALAFPPGSEIIMSALTIREMPDIARKHGLVPIPLDLNLETLAPEISAFESAITPRTRALVIAHLFGTRVPMEPFIAMAKRYGIFVFEDCAQAFTGPNYTGHEQTDAAMFSFGSIKTATALGGALLRLKDTQVLQKIQAIQQGYPEQSNEDFAREVFTHVCVKLFTIPLFFGVFYRACVALNRDFERVISAVRNLPEGEEDLSVIRNQPSPPLVALLARRVADFDRQRLRERAHVGAEFAAALPPGLFCLGKKAAYHSFWVFPVLVEAPEAFATALRDYGFDATTAGSALSVIEPPPGGEVPVAEELRAAYRKLLYLPVYPNVPRGARGRLQAALHELQKDAPHLHVIDARRVYAARLQTVETPRNVTEIREVLEQAQKDNLPVCMMGTRHNLGSHAFVDGAIGIDLRRFQRVLALDPRGKRITVESGITWDRIQEEVSLHGLAVQAMQSDNNFTVGGSLSANAHGRDLHYSTLIQSVLGFRMMFADGSIVSANRTENCELFRLAIGGYGLFGIILDVDLALEEDRVYRQSSRVMPIRDLPGYFNQRIRNDAAAEFFIARPSIAPGSFLDDTIVTVWRKSAARPDNIFQLDHERNVRRDRFLFGLSRKYTWGKTLRWHAEKYISLHPGNGGMVSRNNAMRPPVSAIKMFEYDSPQDTDIIQEFFVPLPHFAHFMEAMRDVLRNSQTNLLGLTIRYVHRDTESFLSYAPREEALAAVLYINEPLAIEGRAKGTGLIQRLTRLAIEHDGTFYLTYIRDLETEDLRRAYLNIDSFFEAKRRFDPQNRFTSRFFQNYSGKFLTARAASAR